MTDDRLWVCDTCLMIGTRVRAELHGAERGCTVRELSEDDSDGVRAVWVQQGRSPVDGSTLDPGVYRRLVNLRQIARHAESPR